VNRAAATVGVADLLSTFMCERPATLMRLGPGGEEAAAQHLRRDFNERYGEMGPRVLEFCLSSYRHGNIDGLRRGSVA
jgi:hypothetical protein